MNFPGSFQQNQALAHLFQNLQMKASGSVRVPHGFRGIRYLGDFKGIFEIKDGHNTFASPDQVLIAMPEI